MKKKRSKLILISVIVLFVLGTVLGYKAYHFYDLERAYQTGTLYDQVITIMGTTRYADNVKDAGYEVDRFDLVMCERIVDVDTHAKPFLRISSSSDNESFGVYFLTSLGEPKEDYYVSCDINKDMEIEDVFFSYANSSSIELVDRDSDKEKELIDELNENLDVLVFDNVKVFVDDVYAATYKKDIRSEQVKAEETESVETESVDSEYFLPKDVAFYDALNSNPVDKNYQIDYTLSTQEIWAADIEKIGEWNQQIDFTTQQLEAALDEENYEKLQEAMERWDSYCQDEISLTRELFGGDGLIPGSMYVATAGDVLVEKSRLTAFTLLSLEYELTGEASYAEVGESTAVIQYEVVPEAYCVEYSQEFEDILSEHTLETKGSDELEELIREMAAEIEEKFGNDYAAHVDEYIDYVDAICEVEGAIGQDTAKIEKMKASRLRLIVTELLNITYVL